MLTQNGIHSNGIHQVAALPEQSRPDPGWRDQFPTFTHNVSWVDTDSKQHSLTIRGDDLDELLATLTAIKHCIRANKAKAAESQPQTSESAESQPDGQPCQVHGVFMPRRWSKRTQGHYFGHKLADGSFCYGKVT